MRLRSTPEYKAWWNKHHGVDQRHLLRKIGGPSALQRILSGIQKAEATPPTPVHQPPPKTHAKRWQLRTFFNRKEKKGRGGK